MRKLFLFTSVFILSLTMWSIQEVGAREFTPTNGLHFYVAEPVLQSSGDDYNIYTLALTNDSGTVSEFDEVYDDIMIAGGANYDVLYTMPTDVINNWKIFVSGSQIYPTDDVTAIYFKFVTGYSDSYFYFVNSSGSIYGGYTLDSIPSTLTIMNIVNVSDDPDLTYYYDGYTDGQDSIYYNGSEYYDYSLEDSYDFQKAIDEMQLNGSEYYGREYIDSLDYTAGRLNLYNEGSTAIGYVLEDSEDYISGKVIGSANNVNASAINFMDGFDKWIVPAIVIVILLGGFIGIANMRKRGD